MSFLAGHDLLARCAESADGKDAAPFVILETGFGDGARFLAAWAAWRSAGQARRPLVYIALPGERAPALSTDNALTEVGALTRRLVAAWPVWTPGMHTLDCGDDADGRASRITLLLGVGRLADMLSQLVAHVDAFVLDSLAPEDEPTEPDQGWLSRLGRLASPGATATWRDGADVVRSGLCRSGFALSADSPRGRYQPRHMPPPLPGGLWPGSPAPLRRHALVIGAGLAGCAASWALARQGWRITLVDAAFAPAQGASGNPGGLFHSIVHGEDGIHARAHRAAALRTAQVVAPWLRAGHLAGACDGLLRLDNRMTADEAGLLLKRLGLPSDHVRWLDQAGAAQCAGLAVPSGGWLFAQGGWLDPAGYALTLLSQARAHARVDFLGGRRVQRLVQHIVGDGQTAWQALDEHGGVISEAPVVVLAGASDTDRLVSTLPETAALPLSAVRGQISCLPLAGSGITAPLMPVAGAGYVLPAHDGQVVFGATSAPDDHDPSVRVADHAHNLAQAVQLGSLAPSAASNDVPRQDLNGRVGWRATTPDRLPYVGPLPHASMPQRYLSDGKRPPRGDQPRFVPRLRDTHGGVYVFSGLGSRGITWAALGAELLASWVTGSPSPVEACLRDALDPARVVTRARAKEHARPEDQADASA